jgi:3D (Asp-Asp-Asp) domain-containing protein
MRSVVLLSLAIALQGAIGARAAQEFEATAYADHGVTASGHATRPGVAAADPRVLPIGTRVQVTGAGPYSGEYVVRDTGRAVAGRRLDIFVPDKRAAKRFGRKRVTIEVISWGDSRATSGRR